MKPLRSSFLLSVKNTQGYASFSPGSNDFYQWQAILCSLKRSNALSKLWLCPERGFISEPRFAPLRVFIDQSAIPSWWLEANRLNSITIVSRQGGKATTTTTATTKLRHAHVAPMVRFILWTRYSYGTTTDLPRMGDLYHHSGDLVRKSLQQLMYEMHMCGFVNHHLLIYLFPTDWSWPSDLSSPCCFLISAVSHTYWNGSVGYRFMLH